MNDMTYCRLCLERKTLINKSHIIPDFMYKGLYDDKHKITSFSPYERATGTNRIKRLSSGEYEGGLLCASCDNGILGGYESYAVKALYGGSFPKETEYPIFQNCIDVNGVKFTHCKNISYHKFKLFLLSMLWRASISSRPFFSGISLGPHEENIRNMIYEGNPGDINDYPIFLATYNNDESMPTDLIAQPKEIKRKTGHRVKLFMIRGVFYMFYVNAKTHTLPEHVLTGTINPNNEMNVIHFPEGWGPRLILGYYGLNEKHNR